MINLNLIFLSAGFLQSLVIIAFILRTKGKTISSYLLISFLVVITLQIFIKGLNKMWVMDHFPVFLALIAYDLPLLLGPLALFYVRFSLNDKPGFSFWDALLFLPFVAELSILESFLLWRPALAESLLPNTDLRLAVHGMIQISLLSYCIYQGLKIVRRAGSIPDADSHHEIAWLRQFLIATFMIGVIVIIALKSMYYFYPSLDGVRFLFLSLTVFIYWITFKVLTTPSIVQHGNIFHALKAVVNRAKYVNSGLKDSHAQAIEADLIAYMNSEKPYLQPGLTAEMLAQALGIQKHHLSQVLNVRLGRTFNEFVNAYRMDKARELLRDPRYNYLTIAGIAFESGFNSVSSFNLIFKKQTGQSPLQFKKAAPLLKTA